MYDREKQALLQKFHRSLTERSLEPDDPYYVPELHQSDPSKDAVARLARQILFNESAAAYLFTGQVGTGKSTKLRRLKQLLEESDCFVVLADMVDFINLNTPFGISALLIAIMGALSEGVSAQIGEDPAHRSFWDRISNFLQTQVQFEEIGLEGGWAKLKLSLQRDPDFKQKLQDDVHRHLSSLVEQVNEFAADKRSAIATKQRLEAADLRVVLLLDWQSRGDVRWRR